MIQTFPIYFMEFEVTLDVKPLGTVSSWGNIIHVSRGGSQSTYGDRLPAIWFRPGTRRLHICSSVNNNNNYCIDRSSNLPTHRFTRIRIAQQFQEASNDYRYSIFIDGRRVHSIINRNPITVPNAKVYMTAVWSAAAKALVKNVNVKTSQGGKREFKCSIIFMLISEAFHFYVYYAISKSL